MTGQMTTVLTRLRLTHVAAYVAQVSTDQRPFLLAAAFAVINGSQQEVDLTNALALFKELSPGEVTKNIYTFVDILLDILQVVIDPTPITLPPTCLHFVFLRPISALLVSTSLPQPPHLTPMYPTLPSPTPPHPTQPDPTPPHPTLPYPTLPYPTLPYPTLPYQPTPAIQPTDPIPTHSTSPRFPWAAASPAPPSSSVSAPP